LKQGGIVGSEEELNLDRRRSIVLMHIHTSIIVLISKRHELNHPTRIIVKQLTNNCTIPEEEEEEEEGEGG
jgi:hypothetical protein